jgi:hypothetical protein
MNLPSPVSYPSVPVLPAVPGPTSGKVVSRCREHWTPPQLGRVGRMLRVVASPPASRASCQGMCWPRQHWVLSTLSQTLLISGGRLLDAFPCEVVLLELRRLTGSSGSMLPRAPFLQLAIGVDHTWVSVPYQSCRHHR